MNFKGRKEKKVIKLQSSAEISTSLNQINNQYKVLLFAIQQVNTEKTRYLPQITPYNSLTETIYKKIQCPITLSPLGQ